MLSGRRASKQMVLQTHANTRCLAWSAQEAKAVNRASMGISGKKKPNR
jgi:hypothetical protein